MLGCDFAFAYRAFKAGVCIFEDVETVVHVFVIFIAFDDRTGESIAYEEEDWCESGEMHFDWLKDKEFKVLGIRIKAERKLVVISSDIKWRD